ncbi:aromatic amino acid aminotransferase [Sphingopyxis lindanitolerans]|uniref:Aromatic amino acid aminotransferase n=1 Tax=Sphingopyxis lindanitolerans TaxID=2054227 RepID=A0A2S8BAB6_9SPHN|nr:aromatic amino acid transaminase [Sphingopyxis lindanitolerans]PQM29364.1 aromatic amino acid aminotransferase [Sphingopyxis lindanitolerans]
MFENLSPPPADSLMEVGRLFRADNREAKIDLGVGTYRNGEGRIEVMAAVKESERRLLETQTGKGYVGPGGDALFCDLLANTLFPELGALAERQMALVQTPGGTGAYRLGLELAALRFPSARLIVGTPTWPNHIPTAERVGLRCVTYRHYDPASGVVDFGALLAAVADARPGDLFLLHGCCHNPTGAVLSPQQWGALAAALLAARVVPIIDLAYAGMASGMTADAQATRQLIEVLPEAIIAISCSKSFGLYSERTGMLAVRATSTASADACRQTAESLARTLWSNPPDHGAAIVRTILSDADLSSAWRAELHAMRKRLAGVRALLAGSGYPGADRIAAQEGLFAMLTLSPMAIEAMREHHAIYMDPSGRINIAGLNDHNIDRFLAAVRTVSVAQEVA